MTITRTKEHPTHVAVAFLASDVNRFSVNALTGAIEQDPELQVKLSFPHPRSVLTCQREIEHLVEEVGPSGTVVIAFSFMSSALVTTSRLLRQFQAQFVEGGSGPKAAFPAQVEEEQQADPGGIDCRGPVQHHGQETSRSDRAGIAGGQPFGEGDRLS